MTSAKSLTKTAVLDASDKPEDQDEARKRRVKMDFASWRKQTKAGKTTHQEEVGISSAVAMKKAREEAKRKLIQDKAVAKQKAAFGDSDKEVKEAKADQGLDDEGKEDARNYRKFGTKHNQHKTAVFRRELHRSRRGEKKVKGEKEVQVEAKVDTGSAAEKATARNKRNTPAGKDYDFDNKVFITRKDGETLDSARTRTRQKAHAAKRGVKEDKAFDTVVANLRKQHGKDSVITKDNPPKPPTDAQKKAYAAHKAKIAKQDTRDDLEKSSQGRYSRKYSNAGSD